MGFKRGILIYQQISAWWSHYTCLLIISSLCLQSILSLFDVFHTTIISSLTSCHIPPPSPAVGPTRGLIPASSSSNHWDKQWGADERNHGINQVIKLQQCNIKQKEPLPLPRLFPPLGLDGNGGVARWTALLLIFTASLNTLLLS